MYEITTGNNIKTRTHVAVYGSVGSNYERVELYRHAVNVTEPSATFESLITPQHYVSS